MEFDPNIAGPLPESPSSPLAKLVRDHQRQAENAEAQRGDQLRSEIAAEQAALAQEELELNTRELEPLRSEAELSFHGSAAFEAKKCEIQGRLVPRRERIHALQVQLNMPTAGFGPGSWKVAPKDPRALE